MQKVKGLVFIVVIHFSSMVWSQNDLDIDTTLNGIVKTTSDSIFHYPYNRLVPNRLDEIIWDISADSNSRLSTSFTYEEGLRHGVFKYILDDTITIVKGRYLYGKVHGTYFRYRKNGDLDDIYNFSDGILNGPYISISLVRNEIDQIYFFENGKLNGLEFHNGFWNMRSVYHNKNGDLKRGRYIGNDWGGGDLFIVIVRKNRKLKKNMVKKNKAYRDGKLVKIDDRNIRGFRSFIDCKLLWMAKKPYYHYKKEKMIW